jgi:uncharacterized protein YndB with AHSA1/START domain
MTQTVPLSLRLSRVIRADADTLYRAWTDPTMLRHWWRMDGPGWVFADASVDLRVGGRYRLAMTDPNGTTHVALGEYRVLDRPTRIAFTWDWEDPASRVGETLVTVDLAKVGEHETELVLTHERFPDAERMRGHGRGWTQLLKLLDDFMREERA